MTENAIKNTYWNHNGELQKDYDTMIEAEENGTFSFTKASENEFYRYYRYYNDGDLPGWAKGSPILTEYSRRWNQYELSDKGVEKQEERVTERIRREWKRYCRMAERTSKAAE